MLAELVNVRTSDGVRLDGALFRSAETPRLGVDLVIFHHGVGSSFYPPSMHAAMAQELVAQGCSALLVNNRGHDFMYPSPKGWLGAAYEVVDDFRLDSRAWLDFAQAAGFERTALWGHSLGAVKTVYFLATEQDDRVRCALASSPPRLRYASFVGERGGEGRLASFSRAEQLVAEGKPEELVPFDLGRASYFSARSLLDKYGPDDRYDFFRHLPDVHVPLLLTIGGLEGDFRFEALAKQGVSLAGAQANLEFASIEGADHSYMTRISQVWEVARSWLESFSL